MYRNLMDSILPNLLPSQIDELMGWNHDLCRYITRHRLSLPRTRVDDYVFLNINEDDKETVDIVVNNTLRHKVAVEKLKNCLNVTICSILYVNSESILKYIDIGWIKDIKKFGIDSLDNGEELKRILPVLNCVDFRIRKGSLDISPDEILDKMPAVEGFSVDLLDSAVRSPHFFRKLAEKTHNGKGIYHLRYYHHSNQPIDVNDVIDFIENAKFSDEQFETIELTFVHVTGTMEEFFDRMNYVELSPDQEIIFHEEHRSRLYGRGKGPDITINTPSFSLEIIIPFFIADYPPSYDMNDRNSDIYGENHTV